MRSLLALLLLVAALASCHLLVGHAPGGRDLPSRERASLDSTQDLAQDRPASSEAPLSSELGVKLDVASQADLARMLDLKLDAKKLDGGKLDAKKTDAKKTELGTSPCDMDGVCDAGEVCPACLDCCPCGEVDCKKPGVTCTTGGASLATPGQGPGQLTTKQLLTVDPSGPKHFAVYLCGVDFSKVIFTGTQPLDPGSKGAYLGFGVAVPPVSGTQPTNAIWFNVTSTMPALEKSWNNVQPATHDQGYRKYLFQTWYRIGAAQPVESSVKHQYNAEKALPGSEVFDLRLEVWKNGNGTGFLYRAATRLHVCAAKLEGCTWAWNSAINTKGALSWVDLGGAAVQPVSPLGLAGAVIQLWVNSGGDSGNPIQTVSYQRAAVELLP